MAVGTLRPKAASHASASPAAKQPPAAAASHAIVRTPSHEEALARLQFLVEHGSRLGLLVGESGSGKTTLLEKFHDELRRASCLTALVNVAGLEPEELLWSIAVKLQTPVENDWNLFQLWRALNDRLTELRFLREQAVVLLDDAGQATSDLLMHVYRLARSESAADARLSIILAGTRDTVAWLGRPLVELIDLKIELPAWTLAETRALVESRQPHGRPVRFAAAALERLHQLSGGMPRTIARLAELARLAATADGGDSVDAQTIEGVCEQLSVRVK